MERVSLAVIGGGPGGYAAAFRAADLGMDVVVVDEGPKLGGVCLHRGCIPSKALLHAAQLVYDARAAQEWGLEFSKPKIDLSKLRTWNRGVVDGLASGLGDLSRLRNVRVIRARARFRDGETLDLDGTEGPGPLGFQHAIIATGSLPAAPESLRVADERVMDSTAALALREIPKRLLVVGGGYIGLELGTVYAALGAKVTIAEATGSLLPGVDADLVRPLRRHLERHVATVVLSTTIQKLEARSKGVSVHFDGPGVEPQQTFDAVLVATGRRPNTRGLGLERANVDTDERGFVRIDRHMRTSAPRLFAIGDVTGEPMLAHRASRQGRVAAEILAGEPSEYDNVAVPAVVFTDPEIAWCGLSEETARRQGISAQVSRFPWKASGRARTLGRTEGLTKLLFDPETERILGMGIVGARAGELIAEGVVAVETAMLARDIAESIHAHPTLSETIGEAAEAYLGGATHLFPGQQAQAHGRSRPGLREKSGLRRKE